MISFVFPAFNEAENLRRFPTEVFPVFDQLGQPYEILIIDDGSSDDTFAVASSLGGSVSVIKHSENQGLGAAIRTGIKEARGDLLVTMDTDLTFAPNLVSRLLKRFQQGDVDVVIGSPKLAGYGDDIPSYRVFVAYAATFIYRMVMGANITSISPVFRLYKREQLLHLPLQTNRFDINAEILFFLLRDGRRVVEVPAELTQRVHGQSKLNYRKEMIRHLKLVCRLIGLRFKALLR